MRESGFIDLESADSHRSRPACNIATRNEGDKAVVSSWHFRGKRSFSDNQVVLPMPKCFRLHGHNVSGCLALRSSRVVTLPYWIENIAALGRQQTTAFHSGIQVGLSIPRRYIGLGASGDKKVSAGNPASEKDRRPLGR